MSYFLCLKKIPESLNVQIYFSWQIFCPAFKKLFFGQISWEKLPGILFGKNHLKFLLETISLNTFWKKNSRKILNFQIFCKCKCFARHLLKKFFKLPGVLFGKNYLEYFLEKISWKILNFQIYFFLAIFLPGIFKNFVFGKNFCKKLPGILFGKISWITFWKKNSWKFLNFQIYFFLTNFLSGIFKKNFFLGKNYLEFFSGKISWNTFREKLAGILFGKNFLKNLNFQIYFLLEYFLDNLFLIENVLG